MGNCWGSSPVGHLSSTNTSTNKQSGIVKNDEIYNKKRRGEDKREEITQISLPNRPQTSPTRVSTSSVGRIITPDLKVFTLAELKSATKNFKPVTILGEGGFGRVFKGWIDETTLAPCKFGVGMAVAVKRCSPDSLQGIKEWKAEVEFLGKFAHPNLVRLIGYCAEEKDLLLVYEFLRKGSLESQLFYPHVESIPWGTRIKIAIGAARGLDFLHSSENTVIYRDFKAANILLDENYVAKLSDFGLARLGPSNGISHVTTQAVGTYGYAAPEYIATGHLYVKSDVYGFGVVLLEILTGLRGFDIRRPTHKHSLVDMHRPVLHDRSKIKRIIDPRMEEYPTEGAHQLALLIKRCVENDAKSRPSMSEVLHLLERISTILIKPKKSKAHQKKPTIGNGPMDRRPRPIPRNAGPIRR